MHEGSVQWWSPPRPQHFRLLFRCPLQYLKNLSGAATVCYAITLFSHRLCSLKHSTAKHVNTLPNTPTREPLRSSGRTLPSFLLWRWPFWISTEDSTNLAATPLRFFLVNTKVRNITYFISTPTTCTYKGWIHTICHIHIHVSYVQAVGLSIQYHMLQGINNIKNPIIRQLIIITSSCLLPPTHSMCHFIVTTST